MLNRPITKENMQVLGAVTYLCGFSPVHSRYTTKMIQELFLPAIVLNQCLLYEKNHEPVAFCSWAFLSDSLLDRVLNHEYLLQPNDWQSGQHLFFPDFLAPFGQCRVMVRDLRQLFAGWSGHGLRLKQNADDGITLRKSHYSSRYTR
jgi:cytolysin-activating lysine-acyltransferase